jgi:hypothetical protein
MKYTIYHSSTGQILGTVSASSLLLAQLNIGDQPCIDGEYSGETHYVTNGQAQLLPIKPLNDIVWYEFDYNSHTWQPNVIVSQQLARSQRDLLLGLVDKINPVWYNTLTTQQQTELIQYRRLLLDVPQQSGFPIDTAWPAKPSWLL